MKRLFFTIVLPLALEIAVINGCTSPSTKGEVELTDYELAHDHQQIASYYRHEAAMMRQASQQMSVRINVYERLFGPTSDWVSGTRLLAQSYEEAANELDRKAREHLELTAQPRTEVDAQPHLR